MAFDAQDYELRAKLALGCRIIAMEGHSDVVWGHLTVRDPNHPDQLWMKASTVGLEEITPDDLVLIDFEGKKIAGIRERHNEYPIHSEIMRVRPDVQAVVHTHPVLPTILGSAGQSFKPYTHEGCFFWPPDVPIYTEMTDLIVTRDQGESVARALGDHRAMLMKNHGIVIAARSIEEAAVASMLMVKAAKAQLQALTLGDVPYTDEEEAKMKRQHIYHDENIRRAWAYLVRKENRWDGVMRD
jgi:ribulose-5-phosphate 4-epimerase/fuculose-1-phosphate aldolase